MNDTPALKPAFTGEELGASYRPVPPSAIISLILGVLSLLAFAGGPVATCERGMAPFLTPAWYIAPVAVLVAWLSSRYLDQARLEYSGQLVAKLGLLLAVVALVCAPLRYYTKRLLLARESRELANQFLDSLLEHRLDDAYKMMAPAYAQTQPVEEIVEKLGRRAYQSYRDLPLVTTLQGRGEQAQVSYLGELYSDTAGGADDLSHQYLITLDGPSGEPVRYYTSVQLQGAISPDGRWEGRGWTVSQNSYMADSLPDDLKH
jgi:hypothetical protein